jgi:threonyl-tRNA synthetase
LEKVPYMVVVGEKEAKAGSVAVRDRVEGDLGSMPVAQFVERMHAEVSQKRIR